MHIVFMGSPEFAVPSLERLFQSRHKIIGVVTQPDRPRGRSLRTSPTPIKAEALKLGLPLLQPESLNDPQFITQLKAWNAECFLVVGFRILPPVIYQMPEKGTINLHASLLPKYRGAAPIQWALIQGETITGVTTFFIEKDIDTGDLILQDAITIGNGETAGDLHDRLALVGANLLLKTVGLIESGDIKRFPQRGKPTLAPKILPKHCRIDWNLPAEKIVHLIRGLSPKPGAHTFYKNKRIKIFKADTIKKDQPQAPSGSILIDSQKHLMIQTGKGQVYLQEIQMEGKHKMNVLEFIRGCHLKSGDCLE